MGTFKDYYYKQMAEKAGLMDCICKTICAGGWAALWGVYAFANPDLAQQMEQTGASEPLHCFIGVDDLTNTDAVADSIGSIDLTGGLTGLGISCTDCPAPYDSCVGEDITQAWLILFLVAFILTLVPIVAVTLVMCGAKMGSGALLKLGACLYGLGGCGNLAWFITAIVFRFSASGFAMSVGTPWLADQLTDALGDASADAGLDVTWEATGGSSTMPSSALLLFVLILLNLIGCGICCLCICIGLCVCKDKIGEMQKMAMGGIGMGGGGM